MVDKDLFRVHRFDFLSKGSHRGVDVLGNDEASLCNGLWTLMWAIENEGLGGGEEMEIPRHITGELLKL